MNDVDRLSKGGGARKRGTGNTNIPHRLNNEERPVYESAKKKVGDIKGSNLQPVLRLVAVVLLCQDCIGREALLVQCC